MLRSLFVLGLVALGALSSLRSGYYTLLFYLWLAYFRPEEWIYDNFLSALNLSFTVGAGLVLTAFFRGARPIVNARVGLLMAYLLLCTASAFSSMDPAWSQYSLIAFTKAVLIAFTMISLSRDVGKFRLVLVTIGLSLGFECAKQGWANLILAPGAANTNEISFLGDNNCVAVGMVLLAPLLFSLAETASGKWERRMFLFLGIGVVYRGIATYSRGGFLSFGAMGLVYWLRSRNKLPALVIMVLVVAVISQVLPGEFYARMGTITADENNRDASSAGRLHFWQVAIKMAAARPIGVGFYAYNSAYDRFDFSGGTYGSSRSVHSSWFGVLGELGWGGLAMFVMIYGTSLHACGKVRRLARGSLNPDMQKLERIATGFETGLIGYGVGGSFVPFHNNEMLWHWFGLTILLESLARETAALPEPAPSEEVVDPHEASGGMPDQSPSPAPSASGGEPDRR